RVAAVEPLGPPSETAAVPAPGAIPAAAPAAADRPERTEPTAIERRRATANAGRGLVGHTALTVPAGSVEVSMRSIVPYAGLATIAAGISSTTELSADLGGALDSDGPVAIYGAGIKQVLVRGDRMQLSVGGSIRRIQEGRTLTMGQFGGTLSACTDSECTGLFSAGISGVFVPREEVMVPVLSLGLSVGSEHTRLLGEAFMIAGGAILFGGLRFGSARFTGDLGLMSVLEDGTELMPFVGFGVRM
ncbi:MAG TPA: hypothetical protein VN253_13990, partial [Kofleriaceae bacterium]|nr:hypothetical protein [Kofleriaceae bacterium]